MSNRWLIAILVGVVVLGTAFLFGMISFVVSSGEKGSLRIFGSGKVAVIKLEGAIISSDDIIEDIEKVRKDKSVASVIFRIESPGGSVGASQEILEAIQLLAEEKPVVASMGSVAASGGYYVALGARKILASPGTITGSIGVRMEHVNIDKLLDWAKIGHTTLKSGRYKDLGAIDRPLSPEDKRILEELLQKLHLQFKEAVSESRKLKMEEVDKIADGRVFTGQEAVELGLIDEIGGFTRAIGVAGEMGGIDGEPELTYPRRGRMWFMRLVEDARIAIGSFTQGTTEYWRPVMSLSDNGHTS